MAEFLSLYLLIIVLGVFGLGFLIAEMFLPGFGLPGISGALLELASVYVAYARYGITAALIVLVLLLLLDALSFSIALRSIRKGRLSKTDIVLKDTEAPKEEAKIADEMMIFVGHKGTTVTAMRPVGVIDLNGVRLEASTQGEYLDKGIAIKVIRVEGKRLIVKA